MKTFINSIKKNRNVDTIYGLRFDSSFKKVYKDENNLKQLLKNLFHEDIKEKMYYRDKELVKDNVNLKCGVCDLVVETKKNILLIEVQNKNLKDFKKRIKRYVSILYATQKFEKNYNEIKPVKVYMILNYKEATKKVLKSFSELEKNLKEKFDILSEIKVWNIKEALEVGKGIDYESARLFLLDQYTKAEAIKILKESLQNNRLKEVVEDIVIYNLDLKTYQRLKEEEMMIETTFEFETSGLRMEAEKKARKEGRRRGLQEGRKEGIEVGKKVGIEVGKKVGKLETAVSMMKEGLDISLIQKVTGLTKVEITSRTRA